MNRIFKSQKRYERDCSPWKHISQRATKHEKRSIQSLLDHHRWTSLHEKEKRGEPLLYCYIKMLLGVVRERKCICVCGKCGKVDRSFCEFRCLFQWIIWRDINHYYSTSKYQPHTYAQTHVFTQNTYNVASI